MPLFRISDSKLKLLESKSFKLEIDLQKLIDNNLKELFGFDFIKTEFGGQGLSIDTIAYDPETKAPVLIEYKRDEQDTVFDQGMSYLGWLLEHKGDYKVELMEKIGKKEIDWTQTKVIFIARNFSKYHIKAASFRNLPIELWRYDFYDNFLLLEKIELVKSDISISSVVKNYSAEKITKEIKPYTVEQHLQKGSPLTQELFNQFDEGFPNIAQGFEKHPVKYWIGYYKGGYNLVEISIQKKKLILSLLRAKPSDLSDPEQKMKYMPYSLKNYNKHISTVNINNQSDVVYSLMLIKQLYEKYKGKVGNW
ncbi:MAG: hypothetical protein ABIH38_00685 [Patescibacteria group bacterium]